MITQIRPGIHHLGDQIIWVSCEIAKGRKHFNVELVPGVYNLFPNITWSNDLTRYSCSFDLNFSCKLVKFDECKFEACEIPKNPYITIQFDSSKDSNPEGCVGKKTFCLGEDWKKWIIEKYTSLGLQLVDVGERKYKLEQAAYVMKHSKGHVGVASAYGLLSRCVGVPFTHFYYNASFKYTVENNPEYQATYLNLCSINGITNYFRDENLDTSIFAKNAN